MSKYYPPQGPISPITERQITHIMWFMDKGGEYMDDMLRLMAGKRPFDLLASNLVELKIKLLRLTDPKQRPIGHYIWRKIKRQEHPGVDFTAPNYGEKSKPATPKLCPKTIKVSPLVNNSTKLTSVQSTMEKTERSSFIQKMKNITWSFRLLLASDMSH